MLRAKSKSRHSKKRGHHRAKRKRQAALESKQLDEGAPLGTYLIDDVALELFSSSGGSVDATVAEFVALVRKEITLAGWLATISAKNQFDLEPRLRRLSKHFFADLRAIRSRIERNKNPQKTDLHLATDSRRFSSFRKRGEGGDEHSVLLAALQNTSTLIEDYLERYQPRLRAGNHDNRAGTFTEDVFDLWCRWYSGAESPDETRLFVRLLSAAWRDVGFPTDEVNGRDLQVWFSDRVRKKYSRGISEARISQQEWWAPEPLEAPTLRPNGLKPPRPPKPTD